MPISREKPQDSGLHVYPAVAVVVSIVVVIVVVVIAVYPPLWYKLPLVSFAVEIDYSFGD